MKSSLVVAGGGGGHSQQNGGPAGGGVDSHNSHPPRQQQHHRPDPQHHQPQQQQQSAASAAASQLQKSDPASKTGGSVAATGGLGGPCYEKPQGVQHTLQVPPTAAPRRSMSGQAGPPSAAQRGAAGAASRRTRFALQVRKIFKYNFIYKILLKLGLKIRMCFLHIFQQNAGQVYITVCYVWRQESTVFLVVSAPAPSTFLLTN
jgi:hypothetical protein